MRNSLLHSGCLNTWSINNTFPPRFLKFVSKVYNAVAREVEVVHVDEQAGAVVPKFFLWRIGEGKWFSYATCPFDTNQAVAPVDLVHKIAANGGIGVLNEVGVCAIE